MKRSAALILCVLSACSDQAQAVHGRSFDPVAFFSGSSHGEATLKPIVGSSHHVSVASRGWPDRRGGIVLYQSIREEGKPSRDRYWTLHPTGRNRWTGTLSDAKGPVFVARTPTAVTIHYTMRNGIGVTQTLAELVNGDVANHLAASRFGLGLATLDERIRKAPAVR